MSTASDVAALQGAVGTLQLQMVVLQQRLTRAEKDILSLKTDLAKLKKG